ncbi:MULTISPECIES: erythromycin esterase family protein [Brevibacillus]|uniref:erythromycin esterase family protein n=1 Tax=Brevibacillus TaxID=55080 RepID=UPI000EC9C9F6|nr:erythromycin esterase family protein [Brevibacillus sp.]HBZ83444.1 erythromycin esterase [Brevibacillus sp.]
MKKIVLIAASLLLMLSVLTGFDTPAPAASSLQSSLQKYAVPVAKMELPAKTIIGFGEATHGNKQFTTLTLDVFRHVVEKQGYRVFAIEGDFGGAQKVNDFLLGGHVTANDAAKAIGFAIYNTQEMADLLSWMRTYNEKQPADQKIHFYGFDMQRYDHNKTRLFAYLQKVDPALASESAKALAKLTDQTVSDEKLAKESLASTRHMLERIKQNKTAYIAKSSEKDYELAVAYAESIMQNATLHGTNVPYGSTRDRFMADRVNWILAFEKKFYGRQQLFIAGHNGHIEKTSTTAGITASMGAHLAKTWGDQYYAIGSEFYESSFLAKDASTNERKLFHVKNSGEQRLAVLFAKTGMADGFLDFAKTRQDTAFSAYVNRAQPISAIGDMFASWYGSIEKMYTLQMVPAKAFDALVFVRTATPSVMLAE